jgi:hypothetical protein
MNVDEQVTNKHSYPFLELLLLQGEVAVLLLSHMP